MALLFGVSRLCHLLFWTCICFLPQEGPSFAHGYPLHDDAGMLYPEASNQITPQASLSTNHDFDSHYYEVHHKDNDISESAENFGEELQIPPAERGQLSAVSSEKNYGDEDPASRHPFGLLVKEHTQHRDVEGVTFPTMREFKRFIDRMKSSFLTPGSDLSKHFETAREIMVHRLAPNAGNTEGESHTGDESDPTNEENTHHEATVKETWSGPMNEVFEQSDGAPSYQIQSESPSDLKHADSASDFISNDAYENQGRGTDAAVHQHSQPEASQFDNEQSYSTKDNSIRIPDLQNFDVYSTNSEQILSDSSNPSPDFSYFSSKTSKSLKKKIHPQDHKGSRKPGEELQIVELGGETDIVSAPDHQPLGSYGKGLHVSAPRSQLQVQDYVPKNKKERPVPTLPAYKPTALQETNYIDYVPPVHPPTPLGVLSTSESPPPQSASSHTSAETGGPRYISVRPFSFYLDGYLGEQRLGVSHPSIYHVQVKSGEDLKPAEQDLTSAVQESDEVSNNILPLFSNGLDSTQSQISSQVGVAYASFASQTGSAPASETSFSRAAGEEFTSESSGVPGKNIHRFTTFGFRGAQRLPSGFPALQRPDIFLNGDFISGLRARHQQSLKRLPFFMNKEHGNMAFKHPKPFTVPRISASTSNSLLWGKNVKSKSLPPQTGLIMSPPLQTYVVKSANGYIRGKVSRSKTRYDPHQPNQSKHNRSNHGNMNTKALQGSARQELDYHKE